ncbi:MAG: TetR/AcrR family transcriptional regulator [Ignavibacteria bacterium]|nr:TetR/AcrR family transcriptional regulator [Ignavibacteria bacterium]
MDKFNYYKTAHRSSGKQELSLDTELNILNAAKRVFYRKGLYGARMQEIADEAGINKAMLHYYFKSKDKLFGAVFEEASESFFPKIMQYINIDLPLFEKIEYFVENYIDLLLKNPEIPSFIITEMHHNPDRIKKLFSEKGLTISNRLMNDISKAVSKGEINPVNPIQLMLNIISLCIFPVAAKPMVQTITNKDDDDYRRLIESRKKEVSQFIISAIKNSR